MLARLAGQVQRRPTSTVNESGHSLRCSGVCMRRKPRLSTYYASMDGRQWPNAGRVELHRAKGGPRLCRAANVQYMDESECPESAYRHELSLASTTPPIALLVAQRDGRAWKAARDARLAYCILLPQFWPRNNLRDGGTRRMSVDSVLRSGEMVMRPGLTSSTRCSNASWMPSFRFADTSVKRQPLLSAKLRASVVVTVRDDSCRCRKGACSPSSQLRLL